MSSQTDESQDDRSGQLRFRYIKAVQAMRVKHLMHVCYQVVDILDGMHRNKANVQRGFMKDVLHLQEVFDAYEADPSTAHVVIEVANRFLRAHAKESFIQPMVYAGQ